MRSGSQVGQCQLATFDKRAHAFLDVRCQQRRVVLEDGVVERRGKLAHLEQFVCGASR